MEGRAADHWNRVYGGRDSRSLSWHQDDPGNSVEWTCAVTTPSSAVVDVGAGTSRLVDRLAARGYSDLTVLDVAQTALDEVAQRLGDTASNVHFIAADVLEWIPSRRYDLWHDRAVFHFLVDDGDRDRYVSVVRAAVRAGGHVILATFAPSGPETCSGLPTMRYDATSLVEALGPDFVAVRTEYCDHVTPNGDIQPFTWVCVRRED